MGFNLTGKIGTAQEWAVNRTYIRGAGIPTILRYTVELKDGRWGCFEIKLSEDKVADGVKNLLAFSKKATENEAMNIRPPSFLAVLVGRTSFMRTTPEGVHIIPITKLTV